MNYSNAAENTMLCSLIEFFAVTTKKTFCTHKKCEKYQVIQYQTEL